MRVGWLDKLIGGTVAAPIEALDKLFTSDDERLSRAEIMARIEQAPALAQVELNKVEAASRTFFIAGWRPAIGWICAVGLAFPFLINPCLQWYTGVAGPVLPVDVIGELVVALLGLSGLRTFEKLKGASK